MYPITLGEALETVTIELQLSESVGIGPHSHNQTIEIKKKGYRYVWIVSISLRLSIFKLLMRSQIESTSTPYCQITSEQFPSNLQN